MPSFAEIRKAVVAVIGAAVEIANAGLVHGTAAHVVAIVVAAAVALGVYVVPNGVKVAKKS